MDYRLFLQRNLERGGRGEEENKQEWERGRERMREREKKEGRQ